MRIEHIQPCAALAPFVDRYWSWEGEPGERAAMPTLLPGTGAEVLFDCRGRGSRLLCVRRRLLALGEAGEVSFIAVRFRAGMLARFVEMPVAELADQDVTAAQLWGRDAAVLERRIADTPTASARAALIEGFLLGRVRRAGAISPLERAAAAIYHDHRASIDHVANACGLGRRQLERRFMQLLGQSPAEVRRTSRLQKTVRALMLDPTLAPLDAALAHGYFDQSHFIRDFRSLADTTPQRYLAHARQRRHFYNPPARA